MTILYVYAHFRHFYSVVYTSVLLYYRAGNDVVYYVYTNDLPCSAQNDEPSESNWMQRKKKPTKN